MFKLQFDDLRDSTNSMVESKATSFQLEFLANFSDGVLLLLTMNLLSIKQCQVKKKLTGKKDNMTKFLYLNLDMNVENITSKVEFDL